MILTEVLVLSSILLLILGILQYQKYNDILKTLASLVSFNTLSIILVVTLSYVLLRFLLIQ
ncbi:MAG: hypothetical protein ABIJ36_02160 [Patescibacteria group bacterium]|nr:hypothetical protein [Patescibacteria group bacterium]